MATHTYGDWKVTKEATETEEGSRERGCAVCEYVQTETMTPLVYMVSRMVQSVNAMRQDAQKQSRKFCRSKEDKKSKTHPIQPKKGETGCVLGAGGDGNS